MSPIHGLLSYPDPAGDHKQHSALPAIPVLETGPGFALATLNQNRARANALMDLATAHYPTRLLTTLDWVSRAWLVRWDNAHLAEIDAVAAALGRPGAYFFSVNYEWGCTCRVMPSSDLAVSASTLQRSGVASATPPSTAIFCSMKTLAAQLVGTAR